jgi:hypothetical protein
MSTPRPGPYLPAHWEGNLRNNKVKTLKFVNSKELLVENQICTGPTIIYAKQLIIIYMTRWKSAMTRWMEAIYVEKYETVLNNTTNLILGD